MIPEIEGKKRVLRAVTVMLVMLLCLPVIQLALADGNKNTKSPRKSKQKAKDSVATKDTILAECDEDFKLSGAIQSLPDNQNFIGNWTVNGRVVRVSTSTAIDQPNNAQIVIGANVEIEGCLASDGSILAESIKVKSSGGNVGSTELTGTVESLPSAAGRIGQWSVGGRKINVTSGTRISPNVNMVAIGFSVRVKGMLRQDGSIDAAEIEIRSNGNGPGGFAEFNGTVEALPGTPGQIGVWTVSGRRVNVAANTKIEYENGLAVIGSSVEVKGALQSDGSVNATKIEVENRGVLSEIYGKVESLPAAANLVGVWRVNGSSIVAMASTRIDRRYGAVVVGAYVKVNGTVQSDRSIIATQIDVKQGEGGGGYNNFNPVSTVSAASYLDSNAPEAIVSAFGQNMSSVTLAASSLPLPLSLGDVTVLVDGKPSPLFFISPNQINYQLPPDTPTGVASVMVASRGVPFLQGTVPVAPVAPSLFTANASGDGPPAGFALRVRATGQQVVEPVVRLDASLSKLVPTPIVRRPGEQLFLILYGTGMKLTPNTDGNSGNGFAENVQVTIGGVDSQVIFAGPAPGFVSLEQLNIRIPDNAPTNPNTQVIVKVRDQFNSQKQANTVIISLQ